MKLWYVYHCDDLIGHTGFFDKINHLGFVTKKLADEKAKELNFSDQSYWHHYGVSHEAE